MTSMSEGGSKFVGSTPIVWTETDIFLLQVRSIDYDCEDWKKRPNWILDDSFGQASKHKLELLPSSHELESLINFKQVTHLGKRVSWAEFHVEGAIDRYREKIAEM